jgi:D-inositol-3-phosphate glycosyltransferase
VCYVRRWSADLPTEVVVEPGFTVVHVDAGAPDLPKESLPDVVDEFADGVKWHLQNGRPADVLHANYWLSGMAGHRLKHELDIPLVTTFHTLARVKAEGGDPEPLRREHAEATIVGCADAVCVSCAAEHEQFVRLYGEPPGTIEVVAPGVHHAFFTPGDKPGARRALGLDLSPGPMLLFVGRIQPLKGADVAVRTLADVCRTHPETQLVIVGGASGLEGSAAVREVQDLVESLGLRDRVLFVDPQPHHLLSSFYRAADAVLVPSRSESFGLVALEAAACGTPVIAAAVGGLTTLVDDGITGYLVERRDPALFADRVRMLLDRPDLAAVMGDAGAKRSLRYTWSLAAARLRRLYTDLAQRSPVLCV